uniref:CSON009103 protein n=1 Tax=Culicoides sonorensis TaxID=179676 RepID=A0A336MXG8_CULSO
MKLNNKDEETQEQAFSKRFRGSLRKIKSGGIKLKMAKMKDDEFWTDERKQYLLRTVQSNPEVLQIQNKTELEHHFASLAEKLGTTPTECSRYYTLMHSKYQRQKKKLSEGKKLKNNWPYFDDFQLIESDFNRASETKPDPKCELTPQLQNVFLAKKPNNIQINPYQEQGSVVKMEGAYDNVAFNSGSSEDEEDFPTQSHSIPSMTVNPRKRPLSPIHDNRSSVFKKAGDYMIAELENMEPEKAQLLLNKTLKFFVEHRYD